MLNSPHAGFGTSLRRCKLDLGHLQQTLNCHSDLCDVVHWRQCASGGAYSQAGSKPASTAQRNSPGLEAARPCRHNAGRVCQRRVRNCPSAVLGSVWAERLERPLSQQLHMPLNTAACQPEVKGATTPDAAHQTAEDAGGGHQAWGHREASRRAAQGYNERGTKAS